jgi:hypothetical protein
MPTCHKARRVWRAAFSFYGLPDSLCVDADHQAHDRIGVRLTTFALQGGEGGARLARKSRPKAPAATSNTAVRSPKPAWRAQLRLHYRYRHLAARMGGAHKALTAVARELAGFVWAVGRVLDEQAAAAA